MSRITGRQVNESSVPVLRVLKSNNSPKLTYTRQQDSNLETVAQCQQGRVFQEEETDFGLVSMTSS